MAINYYTPLTQNINSAKSIYVNTNKSITIIKNHIKSTNVGNL